MTAKRTWQQVLDDQVAAMEEDRPERRSIAINLPATMYSVVARAAATRKMSLTAFARRAAVAVAAYDLDLDWDEVMADEPGILPEKATGHVRWQNLPQPRGHGYGAWRIVELADYDADGRTLPVET